MNDDHSDARVLRRTQAWIEHVVLGLSLCPYAKQPWQQDRVRLQLTQARDADALLARLADELRFLADADPAEVETTLLIAPHMLASFEDFLDFMDLAEACVEALDLEGEIQVASFHPDFQFGDAPADDAAHATNRSPYPTLHLIREASIEAAVAAHPDPDRIWQRNLEVMRQLGPDGWDALRARFAD